MKYRHRVLVFLLILSIITFVDRVCISVAGKSMQDDLRLTPEMWGWIQGAFAIAYALFEIPTGAAADRKGPRRILTRIVVWWSVFTSLTGAAVGYGQLLVVRFLFGAGEAGAYPNISATISRWFPPEERARAQGLAWAASRIGAAISPLLVIPIMRAYGWRMSFYIFGGVGLIWAVAWYAWFRDTPAEKPGVTAAERAEIGPPPVPTRGGIPWRRLLLDPNVLWLMLMYHLYCWGSHFYISWLHTFLENGRGYTKDDLLALSWLPFVFGACANVLGGITSDFLVKRIGLKWGRRSVGCFGLAVSAIFLTATALTHDKVYTIVFLACGYAGSDFMVPAAWAVCLDVGRNYSGAVSGAMNGAGQIASFFISVVFGYFVQIFHSYDAPLIPMAILVACGALIWLKIDPTREIAADP
jgi:MFS transporter, ACS family, glucarate transporter